MTHPRTPERDALLRKMWAEGATTPAIAEALELGRSAVYDYRAALGLPNRVNTASENTRWTPEVLARTKQLYFVEGRSAAETAKILGPGFTRASVVGISHRKGWPRTSGQVTKKSAASSNKAAGKFQPIGPVTLHKPEEMATARKERAAYGREAIKRAEASHVSSPNALPFLEARRGCKWPIGEGLTMMSCCNPIHRGVYCEGHSEVAFSANQPRPQDRGDRRAASLTRHDRVRVATPEPLAANDHLWDRAA